MRREDIKAAPGGRDRRRFGVDIGSEGGGSPIDVRMKFLAREPSARAGGPDAGSRSLRSAELTRGEVEDDQRSQ